jgi:hypothetical protein
MRVGCGLSIKAPVRFSGVMVITYCFMAGSIIGLKDWHWQRLFPGKLILAGADEVWGAGPRIVLGQK